MTHLPFDKARCTGSEHDDPQRQCPVRDTCARYRDWPVVGTMTGQPIPVMDAPNECDMRLEYTEPENDQQ